MNERDEADVDLARFSERTIAFAIDYFLCAIGYFASLKLVFPRYPVRINPHGVGWSLLWIGLFILYQAYGSSQGRVTIGKRLLGLKVLNLNHEPLGLGEALLRAVAYLISSIFSLGFLWPWLNPTRQCWHDMLVGSVVVREKVRTTVSLIWIRAGAISCLLLFSGIWVWEFAIANRYFSIMTVAHASVGMKEVAFLQREHRAKYGRYARDLVELANVSIDPRGFLGDMSKLFDLDTGFRIDAAKKGYTILAKARDLEGSTVRFAGQ